MTIENSISRQNRPIVPFVPQPNSAATKRSRTRIRPVEQDYSGVVSSTTPDFPLETVSAFAAFTAVGETSGLGCPQQPKTLKMQITNIAIRKRMIVATQFNQLPCLTLRRPAFPRVEAA